MKKHLLVILLSTCVLNGFSQDSLSMKHDYTREEHLTKSRHLATLGFVMLGGGIGITYLIATMDNGKGSSAGEYALMALGTAGVLGSIPVFISAFSHKHKANKMSTGIFLEPTIPGHRPTSLPAAIPAVGFRIRL